MPEVSAFMVMVSFLLLPKEFDVDVKQLQIVFSYGYSNSGIAEACLRKEAE